MTKSSLDTQVEALATHLEELTRKHGRFIWDGDFSNVVMLIANVQLALRHPGNKGESSVIARNIIDAWITVLDASSPGIGELLRLGFDPAFDVASATAGQHPCADSRKLETKDSATTEEVQHG